MSNVIQGLREDLNRFRRMITEEAVLSCSEEEKAVLLEQSGNLIHRLDAVVESSLTVGLLGGTGVGKSSLMNGLAESPIASTSHRRPHTDRVLVYRHKDAPLPLPFQGKAGLGDSEAGGGRGFSSDGGESESDPLWLEVPHHADPIRHVILCDLPDFDSLVGEHRLRVLRFLEHLDIVVWVVSPEKYADARFHEFLREVPKAKRNFTFVLNKVDLLFEGRTVEAGYGELGKVIARLTEHLRQGEVADPIIYAVSAADAASSAHSSPWNQFSHFRHQIFQMRDAKEINAVKAANLDVEVRRFLLVVEREMLHLERIQEVLSELVMELEDGREEWVEAGKEAFQHWLHGDFRSVVFDLLVDPSQLVGPGHLVAQAAHAVRVWSGSAKSGDSSDHAPIPQGTAFLLESQMERLENRIAHQLLHRGLPLNAAGPPDGLCSAASDWRRFSGKVHESMSMRVGEHRAAGPAGFRLLQRGVYSAVFLVFLVALGGGDPWRDFLGAPGPGALLNLAVEILIRLFSPTGVAALGSYLILQILLGFRFYSRYKKSLQRRAQKFIESLKLGLVSMWEEELLAVIGRLTERKRELEARAAELSSLKRGTGRD